MVILAPHSSNATSTLMKDLKSRVLKWAGYFPRSSYKGYDIICIIFSVFSFQFSKFYCYSGQIFRKIIERFYAV